MKKTLLFAVLFWLGLSLFAGAENVSRPAYDPIVPIMCDHITPDDVRELHQKYDVRRFFLCGPSAAKARIEGSLTLADYDTVAQNILRYQKELAPEGIEIYWWCTPSITLGYKSPFQHVIGDDGTVSPLGFCPLDRDMQKCFSERVAHVAKVAHPKIILLEDDFYGQRGVRFGCFCPLHLADFAKRAGRAYTREELRKIFMEDKPETLPLRKIFETCNREAMVELSTAIRQAVDAVDPTIRIGLCEHGGTTSEGYSTVAVAEALAGKKTKPLVRPFGTEYSSRDAARIIPVRMAHLMYGMERAPENFEWMHEADTYPHTTYFMSAAYLETLMNYALFLGCDNTLLYAGQYLDDMAEDASYYEMYRKNLPRFKALHALGKELDLLGVRVIHDQFSVAATVISSRSSHDWYAGGGDYIWGCSMLARMGIPYSTKQGTPALLIGTEAEVLSDAEIEKLLSEPLLLDAGAAEVLFSRGYGADLGVNIKPLGTNAICAEKLADLPELSGIKGRYIYNFLYAPAGSEGSSKLTCFELLPGAEAVTYSLGLDDKIVQPGIVRFVNRRGGRVVVIPTIAGNESSNLFSPRKKAVLVKMIEWLRQKPLPAVVAGMPNCWLLVRRTPNGTLLAVCDLSLGMRDNVVISLDENLRGKQIFELNNEGAWQKIDADTKNGKFTIPGRLEPARMRFFLVRKKYGGDDHYTSPTAQ